MEKKEKPFAGRVLNGFLMLFTVLVPIPAAGVCAGLLLPTAWGISLASVIGVGWIIMLCGFMTLEPGEARVMLFFGQYRGTFTRTGYFWVNPFYTGKKLSLRARNLDATPIKVNDRAGNPVLIGLMLVWRLADTYRAMFDIDAETIAADAQQKSQNVGSNVAGRYAYDESSESGSGATLRDGGQEINDLLVRTLGERLDIAGIEVVEARLNYLAYAPEIAAVMLRRQQASAVVAAREKIVEGAVSMVKMALGKIEAEGIVSLSEERKAAMVGNLLVVLCGDEAAQPVVGTGATEA